MGIIHSCTSNKTQDFEKLKQLVANMKAKSASYILLLLIIVTVFVFWSFIPKEPSGIDKKIKKKLDSVYSEYDLGDIIYNDANSNKLINYYIASSYNTCRGPSGYENMVSIAALRHALKKGARALDFEIYSINKQPHVAASDYATFKMKNTFNHLKVGTVLKEIEDNAFSSFVGQAADYPIFLNFRMKTRDQAVYGMLFDKIKSIFGNKLLSGNHRNEQALLDTPLKELKRKVIIIMNAPEMQ